MSSRLSRAESRPPKPKPENLLAVAVKKWLATLPRKLDGLNNHENVEFLVAQVPKRYTIYEPMVLLPSGSFGTQAWQSLLHGGMLEDESRHRLWQLILRELPQSRSAPLSHLAVNEGIPPTIIGAADGISGNDIGENIIRAPSALRVLYGDFGSPEGKPTPSDQDFRQAFWVSTKQLGLTQMWAPRWTMFSRGNVKEKQRLLDFHDKSRGEQKSSISFATVPNAFAIDLYAGIGYFTFTYAKRNARVLCWEINPWSVEALRRGAIANGWSVKVVKGSELTRPTSHLVSEEHTIVVFLEDNSCAPRRIEELRAAGTKLNIVHVNCGLLPTSELTWRPCWDMTAANRPEACWLHLHENVGVHDIEKRRTEMQALFDQWANDQTESPARKRVAFVEHVEKVKTYAPDVWHCVFDVYITKTLE